MHEYFGSDGFLRKTLSGFEYRQQQEELAVAIEDFLSGDQHLMAAEAPTGVGKTYAMLLPALRHAEEHGETVLILTSGITLQEQLINKDIPALLDVLDLELPYGLLKGRGNYACIRRAKEVGQEGYLDFGGDKGKASADIASWLYSTETGDLSELTLGDNHPARERIASSYLTCMGSRCPFHEQCFYNRLIRNAVKWRVVVANYHVFFSYLLAQGKPFPVQYDVLLCDEAHKMSDAARSVTGVSADLRNWKKMLRRAPRLDRVENSLLKSAGIRSGNFAEEISDIDHLAESVFGRIELQMPDGAGFNTLPDEIKNDAGTLLARCDTVIRQLASLDELGAEDTVSLSDGEESGISVWNSELTGGRDALRWCISVSDYPQWAYWSSGGSLKSACVLGSALVPHAFADEDVKVVALSATLTVDGSFDYWSAETGLTPDKTLLLDSPFDLASQMKIDIVDLQLPVIDPGYCDTVAKVCRKYARNNGGATLILLSSRRLLNTVSEYLKRNAETDKLEIFVQGELPRSILLEKFRATPRSVLIGMASFREGIDVPGKALTQVIIDRIPFPHPSDPVGAARAQLEGGRNFSRVVLPGAKMQLRQAAGRLVRTGTDRGRVVILDGRVVSRPNWHILDSLPDVPVTKYRVVNNRR